MLALIKEFSDTASGLTRSKRPLTGINGGHRKRTRADVTKEWELLTKLQAKQSRVDDRFRVNRVFSSTSGSKRQPK